MAVFLSPDFSSETPFKTSFKTSSNFENPSDAAEKTILLAGYGWFRGIPEGETNNTELIARALDGQTVRSPDARVAARVSSLVVPVVWDRAFAQVERAIEALRPDLVLALGTDAGAGAMRPEPFGVNWCEGTDAAPENPALESTRSGPICPGGPLVLRGTLPYEAMTLAMLRAGYPAYMGSVEDAQTPAGQRSTTGYYLCNFMTYRLAQYASEHALRAGFMHVPTQPAYAAGRRLARIAGEPAALCEPLRPSMTLPMMIEATRVALGACLGAL